VGETLLQVMTADPVAPRAVDPKVPRDLETICLKCLAKDPADRYPGAAALADDLTRWLNGEPVEACPVSAVQRAVKWVRRNRVTSAIVAVTGLLILSAIGAAWWRQTENLRQQLAEEKRAGELSARLASNGGAAAASVKECEQGLRAGRADLAAPALADADRRMLEGGADELRERVERCRADLAILRALTQIDTFRWTPDENTLPERREVAEQWRAAFEKFGVVPGVTPADEAVRRVADSHVRDRLLTALHLWLVGDPSPGLRELLALIDPDGYRESFRAAAAAWDRARLAGLTGRKEALNQPPWFAAVLGESPGASVDRRREVLEVAARARPSDLTLLMVLGRLEPINQREGAERRLRWRQAAVAAHPECAMAHIALGDALTSEGDVDGAITCFREAIRLEPKYAPTYDSLGGAVGGKGDVEGAIACFREAIRFDPKFALAHKNLGLALHDKGDLDGAIACSREAIRLEPALALAHYDLGVALHDAGDFDGAIVSFKVALRLNPKLVLTHYNLGTALWGKGDLDGAIACFRETIRFEPRLALAYDGLGVALRDKGELDKTIACFREALRIEFAPRSRDNLDQVLRWRVLLPRLPDVIAGRDRPATPDLACEFGVLCGQPFQKRYTAGIRLYTAAFAADPKLVPFFQYDAACQAILALAGRDPDFVAFGIDEWGALTDRARTWLRADLRRWVELAKNPAARLEVRKELARWKWDRDLAPVRDPAWLAAMTPTDRKVWEAFWADVDAALAALAPATADRGPVKP
jgi:tetratricopeptide (TPR) repeat protein